MSHPPISCSFFLCVNVKNKINTKRSKPGIYFLDESRPLLRVMSDRPEVLRAPEARPTLSSQKNTQCDKTPNQRHRTPERLLTTSQQTPLDRLVPNLLVRHASTIRNADRDHTLNTILPLSHTFAVPSYLSTPGYEPPSHLIENQPYQHVLEKNVDLHW